MSFIKKASKNNKKRKMITRRQISDLFSHEQIETTFCNAKFTQIFSEKLITKAKRGDLHLRRYASGVLLSTNKYTKDELVKKLFSEISERYKDRNGGYTRLLKKEKNYLLQLI